MTRVLILTAATGQGHLTAARVLADAFVDAQPGIHVRVLDTCSHPAIRAAAGSYKFFLRRDQRWLSAYHAAVHFFHVPRLGAAVTRSWADGILATEKPDLVVSVHPILNFGIANARESHAPKLPFAVVLTDPYPPFWRGWAEPRATRTIVPTPAAASQLVEWGVTPEQIEIAGIPVPATFRKTPTEESRRSVRDSLALSPDRFTLLINAGSAGRRTTEWVIKKLVAAADLHERIQIIFVAGRNPPLGLRVARLAAPFPIAVLDWCDEISALLDVSDAVFTKAGGLTVSEAMAKGVPVLVDACEGVLPQESGTADSIEREGRGWKIRRPDDVVRLLRDTNPAEWRERRERARASVRGDASTIAASLLTLLPGVRGSRRESQSGS